MAISLLVLIKLILLYLCYCHLWLSLGHMEMIHSIHLNSFAVLIANGQQQNYKPRLA
ncbi:hypothetical protein I4P18_03120 [Enterobacter roggenkampii]|nr:hypothetical protein [Enterobacter roggenkampii]